MKALIDEGLRGVTSNPSIFEKAIAGSADYDEELKELAGDQKSVDEVYEALALRDIALAADLFKPLYDATAGADGYVSLEVNPELAHDTEGTIAEAKRLFTTLDRPNVMIKVPATRAGMPAITELIGSGLNVNVTLIFSLAHYRDVAEAYIKGLESLALRGPSVSGGCALDRVASVASFFVSRVDAAVDRQLERIGEKGLQGKIAVANARLAYRESKRIFSGSRWEGLARRGARAQRVLWASTSTKNPLYSDTLYVDELIGPDTVNTVPPSTLRSFRDHGTVALTLAQRPDEAEGHLRRLASLGVDFDEIAEKLQEDGVGAFASSFGKLKASIEEKRARIASGERGFSAVLGEYESAVDGALARMRDGEIMSRIWAHDHSVWREEPTEITNRLGWLHSPETMTGALEDITSFADEVRGSGFSRALLLGMGGSSLAPEVFRRVFGVREGYLDLAVLDSTDPGAVLEYKREWNPAETLYIVSTKSGGTVETISFMKFFFNRAVEVLGADRAPERFIAITDPGSKLESTARELGFRKIFLNDANIGGRYSALSYFGLVPAALVGVDIELLLERAQVMACNAEGCNCPVAGDNSAAWLGAVIGELAKAGRDKLTLVTSPPLAPFGAWAEQLIAESTGKEGRGILPVSGEELAPPEAYARDRLFVYMRLGGDASYDGALRELAGAGHPAVYLNLRDTYDLGGEFFRWEMATAVAGMIIGINPFDQPNVESAKERTRKMVTLYQGKGRLPELKPSIEEDGIGVYADTAASGVGDALSEFLDSGEPGGDEYEGRSYVALQAYVKPSRQVDEALARLRAAIQNRTRMATTLGYGPRFLHSTGQLHKGDAGRGLFLQITAPMPEDAPIPDRPGAGASSLSFGVLRQAQALGDREALLGAGRRVMRIDLGGDIVEGLRRLTESLG